MFWINISWIVTMDKVEKLKLSNHFIKKKKKSRKILIHCNQNQIKYSIISPDVNLLFLNCYSLWAQRNDIYSYIVSLYLCINISLRMHMYIKWIIRNIYYLFNYMMWIILMSVNWSLNYLYIQNELLMFPWKILF